jgi:multidrug efflux pump
MSLTEFCIRRPVFTIVLSLILVVLGTIGFMRVPLRGYPRLDVPVVMIRTTNDGVSARVIESQITTPIENAVIGIAGLKQMKSVSRMGQSSVILNFNMGVNIDSAVNDVRNRLAKIGKVLPLGTETPVIQKRDPDRLQLAVLSVTDKHLNAMEITDKINRTILPIIEQTQGVANVELFNDREYALKVLLNPSRMAARHVTVNDMTDALTQQNVNVPSGQIKTKDRYYSVLSAGQLHNPQEFKHLVIRSDNGYLLRFGDVSDVRVAAENTDSSMRVNGQSAVGLSIYGAVNDNPITVIQAIHHRINQLNAQLPPSMHVRLVWDGTTFLKAALHEVYRDLAIAIILVVIVIALFLGSIRSAFVPVVTIPICLISACALIYVLGYSLNMFTLLALVLAIGLVVDDAIIMLENIYRHLESGLSAQQAAIVGSHEIVFAIIAMTLTLAAVYAPIGLSQGMTGIIFREFAFTLALTVIVSGFVALTLSPMMCARLLSYPSETKLDRFFNYLMRNYKKVLVRVLRHRWWVVSGLVASIFLGVWLVKSMPSALEPREDMGAFIVRIQAPSNASFDYINRYSKQVESILLKNSNVDKVMMMTNTTSGGFGFVILKPWSARKSSAKQIIQWFTKQTASIAGVNIRASNMSQIGGGGKYGDALRLTVRSNDSYQKIYQAVELLRKAVLKIPGFKAFDSDLQLNDQQYILHINHNLAAALKVNVADISDALRTMLGGAKVTTFEWGDRTYDVLLQVPEKKLNQLQIINQLTVRSAAGKMIPLSTLAHITTEVGPQKLPHDGRQRAATVTIQLSQNTSMGQAIPVIKRLGQSVLPAHYMIKFRGVAKQMLESRSATIFAFVLALIFIYLVLSAQFESFIDPFIILLTVPLSVVGALLTLKLIGIGLSIYTNIGFVTLIGLVAKHGILITEFANKACASGVSTIEAVIEASAKRLRPILMTTVAMVIGAVPLALASGAGAISRQQIGWVVVGGLLLGTAFSLLVVPVAYVMIKRYRNNYP